MKSLTILGCGKLGQTLAHLWHHHQCFRIQQVLTQNQDSAAHACDFIGAGTATHHWQQLEAADCWLIATPDAQIETCASKLAQLKLIQPGDLVFHCSGALGSQQPLATLAAQGANIASVHPIHSFADPANSIQTFPDSHCAHEGDIEALNTLIPAFEAIGAQLIAIDSDHKTLYHAASVMACNYLVGLLDSSLACFEAAGINHQQAQKILLPIVHQTVDNALLQSPEQALTGPISRGDVDTVAKQLHALEQHDSQLGALYKMLGRQTLDVAQRQLGKVNPELEALLSP